MKYKLFPCILCITLFSCHFQKKENTSAVKEVDICIYGGTSAGVVAAYSAKKMGKSVLLVEPGKYLGGMTTGGLGMNRYRKQICSYRIGTPFLSSHWRAL